MSSEDPLSEISLAVKELCTLRVRFGKYGPANYPPDGLLLCELPFEYLRWLKKKGFPAGRRGELLGLLYQLKLDGAEDVFRAFRGNIPRNDPKKSPRRITFD